jgi:hypothetical protein
MNKNRELFPAYFNRKIVISLFLTLAFLVAALPQTAQAATVTCQTYHFVREGQTKPYIAHTYNVRWKAIASANHMDKSEKPEVGQKLCIPPVSSKNSNKTVVPKSDTSANVQVNISAGKIYLTLSGFSENHTYLAKARGLNGGAGGWYRLGFFDVKKNKTQYFSFYVPNDLRDETYVNVCIKDQSTDELVCRTVKN